MSDFSAFDALNRIGGRTMAAGDVTDPLDAARRERMRILALAELLGEIDDVEADAGDGVILEAILLFRDIAAAATAGSVLLEPLLGQPRRKDGQAASTTTEQSERNHHDHPLA